MDFLMNNYMAIFPLEWHITWGPEQILQRKRGSQRNQNKGNKLPHGAVVLNCKKPHTTQKEVPAACRFHYKDVPLSCIPT